MADFVTRVVNDQSCLCNKTYKNVKEREHGRYIYIQGIYLQRIKMASAKNVGNGVAQKSTLKCTLYAYCMWMWLGK